MKLGYFLLASVTQSGKYPIKQVRLGKMAALKGLSVSAKCAAIDASKCSRLNTLECASYGIFKVKLPKSVQYLTLTSLDKKGCKSLQLSNCKKLKALKVIGCKKLKTINLAKCSKLYSLKLKVLDLSRLTKVKHAKTTLKKAFLKNKNVKKVVISHSHLHAM